MTTMIFRLTAGAMLLAATARAEHWAFRAPVERPAPEVADPAWRGHLVDRWIGARLEREGLQPAPEADRATLLRRASFALTGLPPSPEELDAFLADTAPGAWERQVDRLLASPHYGERAARLWLDSARYADSNGQDENMAMAHAWRYRDWVVSAFNRDLPFAEFVTRQLAGDLVGKNLPDAESADALTATGFLVLGPKQLAEQDKDKLLLDIADEQVDTVGRAFLGVSLGCARCHDHKTDPVSARDYHALAGIFRSTRTMEDTGFVSKWRERDASTAAQREALAAHRRERDAVAAARDRIRDEADTALVRRLRDLAPRLLAGEEAGDLPDFAVKRWREAMEKRAPLTAWRKARDAASIGDAWRAEPRLRALRDATPASREEAAGWLAAELTRLSGDDAPAVTPGRRGGAWAEATAAPLDVPHRPELDPPAWTLEAWVRLDRFPGGKDDDRRWIVNKNGNEWVRGHIALVVEGRKAVAYLAPQGGRELQSRVESGDILEKNEWTQLAATYDGTFLRLYVNGEPRSQVRVETPRQAGDGHLRIGGRADGYNGFPEGRIDDVRLFARALDSTELQRRFREPDTFAPEGLVQSWTFDPANAREERALELADWSALARGPGGLFALPEKPEPHWTEAERAALAREEQRLKDLDARAPATPMVLAVEDAAPVRLPVFNRGDHLQPDGEPVPRGLPASLGGEAPRPAIADPASGRRELAAWLADPRHPLAARVMVNRLWRADFGEGLVRTPDDFGLTGEKPDHPELLDALALEFLRGGGSFKAMHRLLLTSRAWKSAATVSDAQRARDPDNHLFARAHRRRLEAEMIRDSVLRVSGRLDLTPGGSLVDFKNRDYVPRDAATDGMLRRALYLPVLRDRMQPEFAFFDFPQPSTCTGRRDASVVAHQALYFLNGPLVRESATALARALEARPGDEADRIRQAFRLLYAREPSAAEAARVTAFLRAAEPSAAWTETCLALLAANEFIHLD